MDKKIQLKREVKFETNVKTSDLLGTLVYGGVPFKQILVQLGSIYLMNGAPALTGLPIVTNEESVENLESGMICKYIMDNFEEVKKKGYENFKKMREKHPEIEI